MNGPFDAFSFITKTVIVLDEKIYDKISKFFVGYNLHLISKPLGIRFPEITGCINDFDRDKYIRIIIMRKAIAYFFKLQNLLNKIKNSLKKKTNDVVHFFHIVISDKYMKVKVIFT